MKSERGNDSYFSKKANAVAPKHHIIQTLLYLAAIIFLLYDSDYSLV